MARILEAQVIIKTCFGDNPANSFRRGCFLQRPEVPIPGVA